MHEESLEQVGIQCSAAHSVAGAAASHVEALVVKLSWVVKSSMLCVGKSA
jgi:hypothetical protein